MHDRSSFASSNRQSMTRRTRFCERCRAASQRTALTCRRVRAERRSFSCDPRSPFAYWVSERVRDALHGAARRLSGESDGSASRPSDADDFRFVRDCGGKSHEPTQCDWRPVRKGRSVLAVLRRPVASSSTGLTTAVELKAFVRGTVGSARSTDHQSPDYYFRPGLTWPLRTQPALCLARMPAGCIFADKGPAAFVDRDDPASCSLICWRFERRAAFCVPVRAADRRSSSYEVGRHSAVRRSRGSRRGHRELGSSLRGAHGRSKRSLDTANETSHAFRLAAGSERESVTGLDRARPSSASWRRSSRRSMSACFGLYGIDAEDRARYEALARRGAADDEPTLMTTRRKTRRRRSPTDDALVGRELLLGSWLVGVAFGRFDPRLATGERADPARARALRPAAFALARHVPRGRRARRSPRHPRRRRRPRRRPRGARSGRRRARAGRRAREPPRLARQGVLPAAHQDVLEEPSQGADLLAARDALGELLGLALHPRLQQGHALPRPERLRRAEARARGAAPRVAHERAARRRDRRPAQGSSPRRRPSSRSCAPSSTR